MLCNRSTDCYEVTSSLASAYHHAAIYAHQNGDVAAARDWAEMVKEVAVDSLGKDSPKVDDINDWITSHLAGPDHIEGATQNE